MRTTGLLQGAALAAAATAATHDAYLWTVDSGNIKESANQVAAYSSFTAERILARRKGVTDKQYMHITDQSVLSDISRYGGWQPPLFGEGQTEQPPKLFIRISGYNGGVSDFNTLPDLWIEEPETTLLDTFDAKFNTKNLCEYTLTAGNKKDISMKYTYLEETKDCLPQREVASLPAIMAVTATVPTADKLSGKGVSSFHRTLIHLAATENIESTLLVLPTTSKLKRPKKSELKRRAEAPLDLPPASTADTPTFSVSNSSSNFTLPKIVPQYFSSESACTNTTNSCMGHGKCVKSHNQYTCKCSSTIVRTNKDGSTKSVQWGGNACQKKDISAEFLLFAGFGVFFMTVIAGALGLLYSMGSTPLPSVIGAGVVGPRAQR